MTGKKEINVNLKADVDRVFSNLHFYYSCTLCELTDTHFNQPLLHRQIYHFFVLTVQFISPDMDGC